MNIWNKRPPISVKLSLWWQRLWVRGDEFHKSLDTDAGIMLHMCDCERRRYNIDLVHRRNKAHTFLNDHY